MIDLTAIIVVLIPTIGVISTIMWKQHQQNHDQKLKILAEFQQYAFTMFNYYRDFMDKIIDKYCKRVSMYSNIKNQKTKHAYLLLDKENLDIDLYKYFDELQYKILKLLESTRTPLSIYLRNKKISAYIISTNSFDVVLDYYFRKVIINSSADNILENINIVENIIDNLENWHYTILQEQMYILEHGRLDKFVNLIVILIKIYMNIRTIFKKNKKNDILS